MEKIHIGGTLTNHLEYEYNYRLFIEPGDYDVICDEDGLIQDNESLEYWATCLNSPWMNTTKSFDIFPMEGYCDKWKCHYFIVTGEVATYYVCGYGYTPEDALKSAIFSYNTIQSKFNKNNKHLWSKED